MLTFGQIFFKSIRHLRYYVGKSISELGLGNILHKLIKHYNQL